MAGHSKWANIKNKKEKTDAQRGKIFTKLGREIAIAVREGGADPANNSRLRDVVAKAKASNMPNDTIARSIKKAAGELGGVTYEEITYEGYGPSGVAVVVQALTDNRNRTAAEVRHIFDKSGGSMGATGCVLWMFDKKGVLVVEQSAGVDEDTLMMAALDAGAEDFAALEDVYELITPFQDFSPARETLEAQGYAFLSAQVQMIPQTTVDLTQDADNAALIERMLERFEDSDDVGDVFHNALLPEME